MLPKKIVKQMIYLLDNELIALPNAAGNPEAAIDKLGVALVGRLDGAEHAEAVLAWVNVLCLSGAQEDVENVARAREGATGAHLKAVLRKHVSDGNKKDDHVGKEQKETYTAGAASSVCRTKAPSTMRIGRKPRA